MDAVGESSLPHAPARPRRRLIGLFIAGMLTLQIATPASYYLGDQAAMATHTTYDERFAWRMFSGKRAERCGVQVTEHVRGPDGPRSRTLRLSTVIHKAWENALTRWRPDVIDAFLDLRCAEPEVARVHLSRRCRTAAGQARPADVAERQCPLRVSVP